MSRPFKDDGKRFPFSPALRQALSAANTSHRASLEVLRDAICEYVGELKDQGVPPVRIVGALRLRVAELGLGDGIGRLVQSDGILDEMVASCLDPGE